MGTRRFYRQLNILLYDSLRREVRREGAPLVRLACNIKMPLVALQRMLDDGKTQSGTARFA